MKQTKLLFQQWHQYRDQLLTRPGLTRSGLETGAAPRAHRDRMTAARERRGRLRSLRAPVSICRNTATGCGCSSTTKASNPPSTPANRHSVRPSHLAQTQLRHSEREGPSLRRDAADRHRNLPPTIPQRLSVRDRHHLTPRCPTASTTTPSRGVNGYISLRLIFSGVRPKYLANACTASRYAFCP